MFSTHAFSTVAKFLRPDSIFIKSIAELLVKEFTAQVLYKKILVLRSFTSKANQLFTLKRLDLRMSTSKAVK